MLIGHWPLTGNINDYSGFNNNATNFGATVSTTIGKIGSSYQFNGTSNYMTINNPVKNATIWTISFWFRRTGSFAWSDILTFNTGVDSTAARIEQNGSSINEYYWFVATGFPSGSLLWVTSGDNIWDHITLVVDDNNAKSYKNGILQYSYTKNSTGLPSSNLINIGRRLTSQYLGMYLNDLRIYDHALSEYEIKELAKAKVIHYTFNDVNEEPTTNITTGPLYTYTPYMSLVKNGQNLTCTMNSSTQYLVIHNGSNHLNKTIAISGIMKKNNIPHALPTARSNTYFSSNASTWFFDPITGYFEIVQYCNTDSVWIFHTPSGTVAGDVITIENFQVEYKNYVTPFVDGTRNIGINDISSFGYNAPTPVFTEVPRYINISKLGGYSTLFDGVNDHFNLTQISEMPFNTGMTFAVWAYPTASSTWARFIDFGNGPSSNNILFARSGTTTTITLHSYNGATSTSLPITGAIENNVWQHFAFTIASNGVARIYKNGVQIGTGTLHVPNVISRSNMYIGRSNWTGDAFYTGYMDDIRLYTTELSATDILALYNRRANLDNLGNVVINEIDNTRSYFPSSVDYSTWTVGQTSATGWSRNGTEAENIILLKENPVNQVDITWATLGNDTASNDDGGFNGSSVPIDRTKKYRYSLWIKRENIGDGRTYFGCGGSTVSNLGSSEVVNTNPYFISYLNSQKPNIGEQWVLIVAHVHPTGYTGGTDPVSGFYDINGNKISSISTDYKWRSTATGGSLRAYLYYSTSTTERQYFYRPRIDLLDGNEPALQDLINCSDNPVLYGKTVADINRKALFNANGEALFRDIDEVTGTQNTNAKQEITNNGTLVINGEFSEVD